MSNSSKPTRFEARLQSSGKAGGGNIRLTPRLPRTAGGAHKLFARQVAEARTTTGHIDLTRLGKLVMAAYQGMERDRRRTNRSISLMAKERERHLSDRERAAELLRVQKRQLDTALNNMRHGLLMFDPDSRVVVINQSYLKMYGLSPEQAKPGCTARELLELRAANGTFAGDIDAYLTSQIIQGGKVDTVFEIPDGRSIRVVNRFMDGGGWVSIHEEVTRQRKAEVALEKALAESARAEKEATAAHARLRDAFEVVPGGLTLFDAEDRYVMWNQRYAELYALTPGAIKVGARFEDALRAGLAAGRYPEASGRDNGWLSGSRSTRKPTACMSSSCPTTAGFGSANGGPPMAAASASASISPKSSSAKSRCGRCSNPIRCRCWSLTAVI
jgi:PAS domain-containing protein